MKDGRIAIIGAGPIGLEAALLARAAGLPTVVFEAGRVAESVRQWGHVRLFSPFEMNSSALGREAVAGMGETPLPDGSELIAGRELADRYLEPLSRSPLLAGTVCEQTRVLSVARRWLHKGDSVGQDARLRDGFELLVSDDRGERLEPAAVVLDCSGTYPNARSIGAGGQRCPGEAECLTDTDYRLADITGADAPRFAGRSTLVVGSGFSAATAVCALGALGETNPGTEVTWITRSRETEPMRRLEGDELPERDRIAAAANALVSSGRVVWLPQHLMREIRRTEGGYEVEVQPGSSGCMVLGFNNIVAHAGYRPDNRLFDELQVHQCYASEGPMKLAAALLGADSGDCLVQPDTDASTLANPEPGFFVLGAKSYGRSSHFLLKAGMQQAYEVVSMVAESRSRA